MPIIDRALLKMLGLHQWSKQRSPPSWSLHSSRAETQRKTQWVHYHVCDRGKHKCGAGQVGMGRQNEVWKGMINVGLLKKVRFKWKRGGGEGVSQTDVCGESLSGRGESESRGATVGVCCQAVEGQVIGAKRIWVGDEVLKGPISRAL